MGDQICKQLNDGVTEAVDLCMAKHSETACYSVDEFDCYTHLTSHPSTIISRFCAAGIKDILIL